MRATVLVAGVLGTVSLAGGGAVLGAVGVIDLSHEQRLVARPPGVVDYMSCPEGDPLGIFHGGDRVWATGRDESRDWIAVRSPAALGTRVWLPAEQVDPDDALGDLPVVECAPTPAASTTTAPSTAPTSSTSTTVASATTAALATTTTLSSSTTASGPSTSGVGTSTSTSVGVTTTAPDGNAPSIGEIISDPDRIWEDGADCSRLPREAEVSADVADDGSGVASATLAWSTGGATGSVPMSGSGDTWTATVGPFAPGTVGAPTAVSLTVSATDASGNTSEVTEESALMLEVCG